VLLWLFISVNPIPLVLAEGMVLHAVALDEEQFRFQPPPEKPWVAEGDRRPM